jgi:hypothetical protein
MRMAGILPKMIDTASPASCALGTGTRLNGSAKMLVAGVGNHQRPPLRARDVVPGPYDVASNAVRMAGPGLASTPQATCGRVPRFGWPTTRAILELE